MYGGVWVIVPSEMLHAKGEWRGAYLEFGTCLGRHWWDLWGLEMLQARDYAYIRVFYDS